MQLTHLSITNYRGIHQIDVPMSRFACFIGRNNAGKSTALQAVSLFFTGTKLSRADFFDDSKPIRIAITLSEITAADISMLAEEHRERIAAITVDGKLTLVRCYETDGKSRLRYVGLVPKDERFLDSAVSSLVKGKKGGPLKSAVVGVFPELEGKLDSSASGAKVRELIQELANAIPGEQKEESDADLPTGIDESIKAFLPEPIYIPAVKNLADDTKTSQTTPFGRILGILMDAVEPQLGNIATLFKELSGKFNRTVQPDGSIVDNRLAEMKLIEGTVEEFVRESFAGVSLEIKVPPPELRTILSSAQILVDDGVTGPIDSKGDGLRRAVVFAVLRSYVSLNQPGAIAGKPPEGPSDRHILLFEEPEIYLHPAAQHTLFEALRVFALRNHVLITTHSPAFFGPNATDNFIRLSKATDPAVSTKPFTVASCVNMNDVKEKDLFQLVCFENNNAAFFFNTVILVEGDSDYIVWPHVLRLLETKWPTVHANARFTRIGGKASIRRYRDFFRRFGVRVVVLTDLDIVTKDFDQLDAGEEIEKRRSVLLQNVDKLIESDGGFSEPKAKHVKKTHDSGDAHSLYKKAKAAYVAAKDGKGDHADAIGALDEFFAWEKRHHRLDVLMDATKTDVLAAKRALLTELRGKDVFVLEKGVLEDYYPEDIIGSDKPSMAQDFCKKIATREAACGLSDKQMCDGKELSEFEIVCRGIVAASSN